MREAAATSRAAGSPASSANPSPLSAGSRAPFAWAGPMDLDFGERRGLRLTWPGLAACAQPKHGLPAIALLPYHRICGHWHPAEWSRGPRLVAWQRQRTLSPGRSRSAEATDKKAGSCFAGRSTATSGAGEAASHLLPCRSPLLFQWLFRLKSFVAELSGTKPLAGSREASAKLTRDHSSRTPRRERRQVQA
jgi:hypothetical protein